jgi:hypothetical protein
MAETTTRQLEAALRMTLQSRVGMPRQVSIQYIVFFFECPDDRPLLRRRQCLSELSRHIIYQTASVLQLHISYIYVIRLQVYITVIREDASKPLSLRALWTTDGPTLMLGGYNKLLSSETFLVPY